MSKRVNQIDLSGYKYISRLFVFESLSSFGLISPVRREPSSVWSRLNSPNLVELGATIGLTKDYHKKLLSNFQNRYKSFTIWNTILSYLLYFLLAAISIFAIAIAFSITGLLTNQPKIASTIFVVIYIFAVILALQIASRLTSTFIDGYYADTLSFVSCLYLLLEIHQEDALVFPTQRNVSLRRVRALKRNITLLAYQYTGITVTPNQLAQVTFKDMEYFVEEKESQILTPTSKTRITLEKELLSFVKILLTSQYGDFEYSRKRVKTTDIPMSQSNLIARRVFRVLNFILPLSILIGLAAYPNQFKVLEPYDNFAVLGSITWLLLAVDASLNLGIMDRFAGLAKTIKELR